MNQGEKYIIPITENGGEELWKEIKKRKLFDLSVANEAEHSEKGLFCWPEIGGTK
jgi:hypothetical protein